MRRLVYLASTTLVLALSIASPPAFAQSRYIIIGNDGKAFFEANGVRNGEGGKDTVTILDIAKPLEPKIVANLPLANSVFGPPTNLQITPDGKLALVANSIVTNKDGDNWKPGPDDKIHVIDLTATPPKLIETITIPGKQPSGLAISKKGDLALVANRQSKSVTVLSINGTKVTSVGDVPVDDEVAAVAITPDGKRAFVAKNTVHKVGVLAIDGTKVTYDKAQDMPVGQGVYNIETTPDGRLALTANTGVGGDGHADTVSVIDAKANPPRVVDHVTVGDGPEGFAISPNGKYVIAVLLKGSAAKQAAWSYSKTGSVRLLEVGKTSLRVLNEVPAGGLPEGVAFSSDSRYVYVGNYIDRNMQIYEIRNGQLIDTGKKMALPGQPASMRGRP